MNKATLYVDVDDTIIAQTYKASGFDLRPGVLTQLRILGRLFDCVWLTCWPRKDIYALIRGLYGIRINKEFKYGDWPHGHAWRKAGYVFDRPKAPENFWWIEDPLAPEEIDALETRGKLDRYIRVEPQGQWGFLDAVNELFRRAGIDEQEIKRVGGKPEWFQKEAILVGNSDLENYGDALGVIDALASASHLSPEERLAEITRYVRQQRATYYPMSK